MSLLWTHRIFRASAVVALALLALALVAACGNGDEGGDQPSAAEPTATAEEAARTPTVTPRLSEMGEAPVFYGTEDGFESLQAGEPYKVLFRITSGYQEETLRIVAEPEAGGDALEFEALRSEPKGEEAPGSYYPVTIELPEPGTWRLTVFAGEDEVTISVQVKSKSSKAPTRY